jgi:hypothetical protein
MRGRGSRVLRGVVTMFGWLVVATTGACASDTDAEDVGETQSAALEFGETSQGTTLRYGGSHQVRVSRFTLSAPYADVTKLSAYVGGGNAWSGATSQPILGVIYADDGGKPGARLCKTSQRTMTSTTPASWVDFPIEGACKLPSSGAYFLGFHIGPGGGVVRWGATPSTRATIAAGDDFTEGPNASMYLPWTEDYRLAVRATFGGSSTPTQPPPPPPPTSGAVKYLKVDTAASQDPVALWGTLACVSSSRHQWISTGGDTHPMPDGSSQGNTSFRRLTAQDGDDYYGERCELGYNSHTQSETFAVFREGERRLTYVSLRLPSSFPLATGTWQVVMQMKQAQPSNNGGGTPVIALEARNGRWSLTQSTSVDASSDTRELWSTPARTGVWTRFLFDVTYSRDAAKGSIQLKVDLDGDNDFEGASEVSPVMRTYTLKRESAGSSTDGVAAGESIPGHLRVGPYHNPSLPGTYVDVDNVEVVIP